MVVIYRAWEFDKQIDRACAAQSSEMLPKPPVTDAQRLAAKQAQIAQLNARFEGMT